MVVNAKQKEGLRTNPQGKVQRQRGMVIFFEYCSNAFACDSQLFSKYKHLFLTLSCIPFSNMTSGDLPGIYKSQCEAYELANIETSQPQPVDDHYIIANSNLSEIPSAAVTGKEEAIYEPTN